MRQNTAGEGGRDCNNPPPLTFNLLRPQLIMNTKSFKHIRFFLLQTNFSLSIADFDKKMAQNASTFNPDGFENSTLKRLFKKIMNIGFAATNDSEQLKAVGLLISLTLQIYCPPPPPPDSISFFFV